MSEDVVAVADTSKWIAVLPLGAHEQHGPHLPFETDTTIASGISRRLAGALDPKLPVTFLPAEPVGYSIEHMDYDGSNTLGYGEAVERWVAIGEHLNGLGIRKMLMLNAHGGNSPLMTIVATELRVRFGMFCVATSWTRFITAGNDLSDDEKAYGIHGGDLETSVMLALAPDSVQMEKAEDFPSFQQELSSNKRYLRAYGPHAFGWKMQDLNQKGVVGNATLATAEKGKKFLTEAVTGLCELIRDMDQFDLSHFEGWN
ncbi:MAG: creatininase family protein [Pseudomonadota bacterium]